MSPQSRVDERSDAVTVLFTDIEDSTRLWEEEPERMRCALARHDDEVRSAVETHRGSVVKMTGDGVFATFPDPLDALDAVIALQLALADSASDHGVLLHVRGGMHMGTVERRADDVFGATVNRAARVMAAAHGGQVLVSKAVFDVVQTRLPAATTLRDLGLVHLRGLSGPEHLYQLKHPGLRQEFPALRSLESTPNNLPQQIASFVGRDRELVAIRRLLDANRLLTLSGAGGLGKSRLALALSAEVLDEFPDGVWFVELAPVGDARLVAQAAASVLGVVEDAGRSVLDALVTHVEKRKLLIVLDNCEHLLGACAELAARLLEAGPQAKVLATSREPLRITGETIFAVPPMPAPDPVGRHSAATLTQYEAARLFVERAKAARPQFSPADDNAEAIAIICHRLDGIPLAIELAASRMRSLPAQAIAQRLDDRFRLLTNGDRNALPRRQTLRACIDWSYDLLAPPERALFRRLAVFAGDWTLEAAEAVGATGALEGESVVDLLLRLVEKSLVELTHEGQRYRLLETVRQYAQERLDQALDAEDARHRHLEYYVAVAEEARKHLSGPGQADWFARLERERENILLAHAWGDRAPEGADLGLRLVRATELYWSRGGLLELGRRVTLEALERPGATVTGVARCDALCAAGNLCFYLGRYEEAQQRGEQSLAVARALGDRSRTVSGLVLCGWAAHARGDLGIARQYDEEALVLARAMAAGGEDRQLASALNNLGELHRAEGNLDAAEPLYAECVTLARGWGDRSNVAVNLLNLAMVSLGRGKSAGVGAMLEEALATAVDLGARRMGRAVLEVTAGMASAVGEWEPAARFYGAAQAQLEQMNLQREPVDEAALAPMIARVLASLGEPAFSRAEAAGRALSYEDAIAAARTWLARVA